MSLLGCSPLYNFPTHAVCLDTSRGDLLLCRLERDCILHDLPLVAGNVSYYAKTIVTGILTERTESSVHSKNSITSSVCPPRNLLLTMSALPFLGGGSAGYYLTSLRLSHRCTHLMVLKVTIKHVMRIIPREIRVLRSRGL